MFVYEHCQEGCQDSGSVCPGGTEDWGCVCLEMNARTLTHTRTHTHTHTHVHEASNWQKTAAANQKTHVKVLIVLWPTGSHATLNNLPSS